MTDINPLEATHPVTDFLEAQSLMRDVLDAAKLPPETRSGVVGLMMMSRCSKSSGLTSVDRHYHGPRHPARMWNVYVRRKARGYRPSFDCDVARFCVFHDIVYGVGAPGQAEQASADEYVRYLYNYHIERSPIRIGNVLNAIARSAQYAQYHPYLNGMVQTCLDLDLYELATPRYWVNSVLIRREMSHVGDEEFRLGRLAFLKAMLLRPRLFYEFIDLEEAARRNMGMEHDMLAAAGDAKRIPWDDWPNNVPEFVRHEVPEEV